MPDWVWVVVVVVGWVWLVTRHDKTMKRAKAQEEARSEAYNLGLINDQLSCIATAETLLPDVEAALRKLTQRYAWTDLCHTVGYGALDLQLMAEAPGYVELPNVDTRYPGDLEFRAAAGAKEQRRILDMEGASLLSMVQEPTTDTLRGLIRAGLLTSEPEPNGVDNRYWLEPSERATRVKELHQKFKRMTDTKQFSGQPEVQAALRKVMRQALV